MADTIQVTEQMGEFIKWASDKGQEEIMRIIRDRLMKLKEWDGQNHGVADEDGFKWDSALEPNDGNNQWKYGGDCNKCRKISYCGTQCRANKLLKKFTTPFLYQLYLEDCPEAAAKAAKSITPEDVLRMVNGNENN